MRDLFISECRRFRNAALIFAAVHLVLQLFLNRMFDVLQLRWEPQLIALLVYMLAGLAFALVQFGSYRQPSRWLWLLHRPVARGAIFGAIALASTTLIVLAVGVPALLTVVGTDVLSARTVDARHYLMVLDLVLLTLMAWLAGSYVILSGRRTAIVVLLLPFVLLGHLASAWMMLLPALLCVALLAYIAYATFKPDRAAPPSGLALVATAVPLQIGFYFAMVWGGSLIFQNLQILTGEHPMNRPVPPAGAFTESTRSEGRELFLRGLAGATDARAAQWRRQVPLLEIANFEASVSRYPVRHQASNLDSLHLVDAARHIEWTFSHDAMRFHGRDTYTSQDRGWLGTGDGGRFGAVPVLQDGCLMLPQELYAWDGAAGAVHLLIRLNAPETLAREPKQVGRLLYVVTNLRLIAYQSPVEGALPALLKESFSVPLPEPFSQLDRIDIAGLLDGTLVSFSFGRGMFTGDGESTQTIVLVDAAGQSRLVARRAIAHDFPALFEHHDWWPAPVLHTLLALPEVLLDNGRILDQGKTRYTNPIDKRRPAIVWGAALAAALLSALFAWHWLRRAQIGSTRKAGWIFACLLLGPPSLACLVVLQGRPFLPLRSKNTEPALAAA